MHRGARRRLIALSLLTLALGGCATLQSLAQLPQVRFHIDGTSDASLAGVDLDRLRRVEDLGPLDLVRVGAAVARRRVPLRFDLHLGAQNNSANRYDLRLERLEWTLMLEDRDTVSGVFDRPVVIEADGSTDIPITIELDLLRFFDSGAKDLAAVAVRAAGAGGPTNVALRARPTVRTPMGPVRFPNEIVIGPRRR
jgi:hypothetical protein